MIRLNCIRLGTPISIAGFACPAPTTQVPIAGGVDLNSAVDEQST